MAKRTILSYPDKRLHTVAKPVQGVDARIKTKLQKEERDMQRSSARRA